MVRITKPNHGANIQTASARQLSPISSRSETKILGTESACTVLHNPSLKVAKSFTLRTDDKEPVVKIP